MAFDVSPDPVVRTRRRWPVVLLGGAGVIAIVAGVLWWQRQQLAQGALDRALTDRGVQARFVVKDIGLRWQRIEKLVIGDPRHPDLTADWADIRLVAGLTGVRATAIRAGGVRLRARVADGKLTLGALDRLLPKADPAKAFALPAIDVALYDARVRLDTPAGPVGARIDGTGNLSGGFSGKLAAIAPRLALGGCSAQRATAYVDVMIAAGGRPHVAGPVRAAALGCGDVAVAGAATALNATFDAALQTADGTARFDAERATRPSLSLAKLHGRAVFAGSLAAMKGTLTAKADTGLMAQVQAQHLTLNAQFAAGPRPSAAGQLRIATLALDPRYSVSIVQIAQRGAATPLGPVLRSLADATTRAGKAVALDADAAFADGTLRITRARATADSGARLAMAGGEGITIGATGIRADTRFSLQGGGFPAITSSLTRRADGVTLGLAQIQPVTAKGGRVALTPLRFAMRPSGALLIETEARIDGPLGDGAVTGLTLPLAIFADGRGGVQVNSRGCTPVRFASLAIEGLTLAPSIFSLCPAGGSALVSVRGGRAVGALSIAAPRTRGMLGKTPISIAADAGRFGLSDTVFALEGLKVRLGSADRESRLDIAELLGRMTSGGARGGFSGATGHIAKVPLLISDGAGPWALDRGVLTLSGGVMVTDEHVPARFNSLKSDDIALRLAGDGVIGVTGSLKTPETGVLVTNVAITHTIRDGSGNAVLDVPGIRFGKALQPEKLTRLTLGVIANVEGGISGRGIIRWTADGVQSTGTFKTDGGLDFAAAFGPVNGLRGTIMFDDLLALSTPAGQRVEIDSVNPGIPVLAGTVRYQLLPGQKIAVERGEWPFAGGTLSLDPTILDMGVEVKRRLTFRIVGLDAAKFIQQLDFDNLAATGTFDGVMPIVFDASGGTIENGKIVARADGGTLAYVGEVSNADMNFFGKLAFDALKSLRYRNLAIALDGPLDGEIISRVDFTGVNTSSASPSRNFIVRQFIGLPFKFNVVIRAPFRGLLNSARSFYDPSILIRQTRPLPDPPGVQPPVSEKKP